MRGPENLLVDLVEEPEAVLGVMDQMTGLWKWVVDYVWGVEGFRAGHNELDGRVERGPVCLCRPERFHVHDQP